MSKKLFKTNTLLNVDLLQNKNLSDYFCLNYIKISTNTNYLFSFNSSNNDSNNISFNIAIKDYLSTVVNENYELIIYSLYNLNDCINILDNNSNIIEKLSSDKDLLFGKEHYFIKYKFNGCNSHLVYNFTINLENSICRESIDNSIIGNNNSINSKLENIFQNTNNNIDFSNINDDLNPINEKKEIDKNIEKFYIIYWRYGKPGNKDMVDKLDPFTKICLPKEQKNMSEPIFQIPDLNYGYYKTTKKYHQINYFCNQAYLESNLIKVKNNNIYRLIIGGFSCPYTNTYIVLVSKSRNNYLEKIPYTKLKNFNQEFYNYYPEIKVSNGRIDNSNAVNIEFETPNDCDSIQVILWLSSNNNVPSKKKIKLRIYLNKFSIEDISNFNTVTLIDNKRDISNDCRLGSISNNVYLENHENNELHNDCNGLIDVDNNFVQSQLNN